MSETRKRPKMKKAVFSIILLEIAMTSFASAEGAQKNPQVGDLIDLAMFGKAMTDDGAAIEWIVPVEVHQVRVSGIPESLAQSLRLEWWADRWPFAIGGEWLGNEWSDTDKNVYQWMGSMALDDPFNGTWVRVSTTPVTGPEDDCWQFNMPVYTKKEFRTSLPPRHYPNGQGPTFRRTYKVRLISDEGTPLPHGAKLQVFGAPRWKEGHVNIELQLNHDGERVGSVEVDRGILVGLSGLESPCFAQVQGNQWKIKGLAGSSGGICLHVLYADSPKPYPYELTRVTVRMGSLPQATGFTFVPQQLLDGEAIRLPDFGALVSLADGGLSMADDPGPSEEYWDRKMRSRIALKDEITHESAMRDIPRLSTAQWAPIGLPNARQEVFISPNGDWRMDIKSLSVGRNMVEQTKARDNERLAFRGPKLEAMLDCRSEPAFDGVDRELSARCLEDDHLPIMHAMWQSDEIQYQHTLATTYLFGDISDDEERRGDETIVLLTKLEITNPTSKAKTAYLSLRYNHDAPIELDEDGVIWIQPDSEVSIPEGLIALRGQIVQEDGDSWVLSNSKEEGVSYVLSWQKVLEPGEKREIHFKAPFVDMLNNNELIQFKKMTFEQEHPRIVAFWKKRLSEGMQIQVPDTALNNLYKANLWHILINTDRDPKTGLYFNNVGTTDLPVYGNETGMTARSMDIRGEHRKAEQFLEPFLRYQGDRPLKGRFTTKENVFHSAGVYTGGEYSMNHGFVMWCVADHYLYSRDRAYMERVAPQLVKGCEFLISERKATMTPAGVPRYPQHGLAPACSLEDVTEFHYWFATNGYYYRGMKSVAEALADINHPQAKRIAAEAENYRRDIEIAIREATTKSPVVKLRNGKYIPYVPSRIDQWWHRSEGWIRETLYPSLHLATAKVIPANDHLITWVIDNLEENVFFSKESGVYLEDVDRWWFSRGGITMQPCMTNIFGVLLARDEIHAALRSFWNTYALLIYPDVQFLAEGINVGYGIAGGYLYKTSDESRFLTWLRDLLVWENDDQLWLGRGIPRLWLTDGKEIIVKQAATIFGPTDLAVKSNTDQGRIHATVKIPTRSVPSEVWLRLRHPNKQRPVRVLVNNQEIPTNQISGEDIRLIPQEIDLTQPVEVVAEYRTN